MSQSDYRQYLNDLSERRGPAMERAARLIAHGKFDEADTIVRQADDSIYGAVALAGLYRATLKSSDGSSPSAWRQGVYERALRWALSAFPPAQTAYEAEDYEQGREEARRDLAALFHRVTAGSGR